MHRLQKLPANPHAENPLDYNQYMNGYNSIQSNKNETPAEFISKIEKILQELMKSKTKSHKCLKMQIISENYE